MITCDFPFNTCASQDVILQKMILVIYNFVLGHSFKRICICNLFFICLLSNNEKTTPSSFKYQNWWQWMQILFYCCLSLFVTSIVDNETNYIRHLGHITPSFSDKITFWNEFLNASSIVAPWMICAMYCQHINSTVYIIPAQILVDLIGYFQKIWTIHILCTICSY